LPHLFNLPSHLSTQSKHNTATYFSELHAQQSHYNQAIICCIGVKNFSSSSSFDYSPHLSVSRGIYKKLHLSPPPPSMRLLVKRKQYDKAPNHELSKVETLQALCKNAPLERKNAKEAKGVSQNKRRQSRTPIQS
jgi:hypothetical protein